MLTYAELFAGVSGMGMGFDRAGMTCRWRVEFDPGAAGVLAYHSPATPLHADVVAFAARLRRARITLSKTEYASYISRIHTDIIAGGSPCQDLSVAGLRKGLDGERSGLFRTMVRICRILRPRYVLWENVLGALSSNSGRDFAAVVGAFTGCVPGVPGDGWGAGGFARAASPGRWHVAWRVLDSQYFGVPQRRRRVFLVASLGDASCVEILFEPESVRGDHPPRRQARQDVAGTLGAHASAGGGLGTDFECDGGVIASTLQTTCGDYSRADDFNMVAHTLAAEGHDASEDGTGRGTPLVAGTVVTGQRKADNNGAHNLIATCREVAQSLTSSYGNSNASGRATPMVRAGGVRRLTPRECERLQGWPDDHTRYRIPLTLFNNQWLVDAMFAAPVEQADAPRYRQCGNGVTTDVAEWIARRIAHYSTPNR